jgi:MoxR-like ATPase
VIHRDDVIAIGALVPRIPSPRGGASRGGAHADVAPHRSAAPKEVRDYVRYGAGPRGSQALVLAAKARAALRGEAAADVDDVRALAVPALRHRVVLSYRAEADGVRDADVIAALLRAAR